MKYRATVELTPNATGTDIEWQATFDGTLRRRLAWRVLQGVYGEVVSRPVVAAEAASDAETARA